jgi:hypothetical protein
MRPRFGQLAQLVEQRIENPRVRGSIPRLATKFLKDASPNRLAFLLSGSCVA